MSAEVSVVLPTFEERDNIGPLIEGVDASVKGLLEIIVVDDDSPDGTWRVAEGMRERFPRLQVIRRTHERGLTSAIRDGIRASRGSVVVWMDCDLSMRPCDIQKLVDAVLQGSDVAVGSRFVPGGRDIRDVRLHRLLSRLICAFGYAVLGRRTVRDCTSGFIALRREVVENFSFDADYGEYFLPLIAHARAQGFAITEVPYTLHPRASGYSKTATHPFDFLVKGRKYVWQILRLRFGR
ncbi:MAG: polyprenol monophosphomannose synthase [Myxococcota bacterium]